MQFFLCSARQDVQRLRRSGITTSDMEKRPASPTMSEPVRHAHLVGSLPFSNEREAMQHALSALGPRLLSLPDGEIGVVSEQFPRGERSSWTAILPMRCMTDVDVWRVVKPVVTNSTGFQKDYQSGMKLRPRVKKRDLAGRLDLGWCEYARESYALFRDLRGEREIKFQVGLPTGLGIAMQIMDKARALRYASCFAERLALEANEVLEFVVGKEDLLFQIELPCEVFMACKLPKCAASLPTRSVLDLVRRISPEASFGLHLCFGDLNNRTLLSGSRPPLTKVVHFLNALLRKWPASHRLSYVHVPLALANIPPTMDESWYRPLGLINLPADCRLIAGFVHEKRTLEEHKRILGFVESMSGHTVDVASSCGLGRRSHEIAEEILETTKAIVQAKDVTC